MVHVENKVTCASCGHQWCTTCRTSNNSCPNCGNPHIKRYTVTQKRMTFDGPPPFGADWAGFSVWRGPNPGGL